MLGHPFGLTSSVLNYCRGSLALTDILVSIFHMVAFCYFDDRFGVTRAPLAEQEGHPVKEVCTWLGIATDEKSQNGRIITGFWCHIKFRHRAT